MDQRGVTGAAFDQHQLGRSAADVEDHRRAFARLKQQVATQHRQPRFFLGRDDVEQDPGFLTHPLDEFGAVLRPAARLGRDRAGQVDVAAPQLVGADLQRAQRAVHRRLAEPSGLGQPFAQPHHPAEGIDDDEVLTLGAGDQQPAIVGAQVDRGKGLAMERSGARRLLPGGGFAAAWAAGVPIGRGGGGTGWPLALGLGGFRSGASP